MADLIAEARRRIEELEVELEELRNFIAVADRLAGREAQPTPSRTRLPQHRPSAPRTDAFPGSSPKAIVAGVHDILSAGGETLDRDVLIDRLAERGVTVPGMYPNKNLGTILWRNQRLFEHERGTGYRWTGEPLEKRKRS